MDFVEEIGFAQVHLFPYSIREGTAAARMKDQIDSRIKDQRLKALKEVTLRSQDAFLDACIGKEVDVLFEKDEEGKAHGYTSNYIKVEVASEAQLENTVCKVLIEKRTKEVLQGTLL